MKSMTKKITATALFGVLAVSAFAGCGGAGSSSNGSSDAGSDAEKKARAQETHSQNSQAFLLRTATTRQTTQLLRL